MNIGRLLNSTNQFAAQLESVLKDLQMLDVCTDLHMDHICVRLSTDENVEHIHNTFGFVGDTISTALIGGRLIHILQLHEPMRVGGWETYAVELPHPKSRSPYAAGWEHVEFVLPGTKNTMADVQGAFESLFPHLQQSRFVEQYQRKDDEPKAGNDQQPNPTIGIKAAGIGFKFHALPIQEVVGYTKPPQ